MRARWYYKLSVRQWNSLTH